MNTKRHSLGSLRLGKLGTREAQQASLPKTTRRCARDSALPLKDRIDEVRDIPLRQPESRNIRLPPMSHKLLNQYLAKPVEVSVVSSDDGSRFMEGMHKPNPDDEFPKQSPMRRTRLVGQQAVSTFYSTYKQLQQRKRLPTSANREAIERILQVLQKYQFPPERMRIVRQKGEEEILFLKGYGMMSSRRSGVLEEVTEIVSGFKVAVLSHNSLSALPFLRSLTMLKKLDVSCNHLSGEAVKQFKTYFERAAFLEELNLENNFLFDHAASALVDELAVYGRLRVLNLSRNSIGAKAGKSLKGLLSNKSSLVELYLHWNELDEEAGRDIFIGLEANRQLKVLDISWNYLGGKIGCTRSMADSIKLTQVLIHLDLSFCGFGEQESKILAEGFRSNHSIYGLHFEGNFGYVNHRGFLVVQESEGDVTTKLKYPLPVNTNYGLKRIHGCDRNTQRYCFRSERSCRDVCWICESWVECAFEFDIPAGPASYVFFNFEGYQPVKLLPGIMYRMCPRGNVYFFFSRNNNQEFHTSPRFPTEAKSTGAIKLAFGKYELKVQMEQQNTLQVDGRHPIDKDYDAEVYCQPRSHEQKPVYRPVKKQKPPEPVPYKQLQPFHFEESPFGEWKHVTDQRLDQCIQFDYRESKLTQMYEDSENLYNLKQALRQQYAVLLSIYYHLASFNRLGNSFSVSPLDLRALIAELGMCDKRFPESVLTVLIGSVAARIHEVELDVDYSAKKIVSGFQTISRPKFVQFVYRMAAERHCKKLKQYQVEKLAKKAEEALGKVVIVVNAEDGHSNEQQVLHVRKDRVLLPIKEAVSRIIKKLQAYLPSIQTQEFRQQQVWSPEACLTLQTYEAFTKPLYQKYFHSHTKLRIKSPGMYYDDWASIFCGLFEGEDKLAARLFLNCKMVEIEEGNHPPSLEFTEFLESLVRVAEWQSLPPQIGNCDLQGAHPSRQPISFKLENAIVWLLKKNTDLSNKFVRRVLDKGGLFQQQMPVFVELASQQAERDKAVPPFQLLSNRITLQTIVDVQRQKYERELELHRQEELRRAEEQRHAERQASKQEAGKQEQQIK